MTKYKEVAVDARMAVCTYGCNPVVSRTNLPFFTDRSAGSEWAKRTCANDDYAPEAHDHDVRTKSHLIGIVCEKFAEHPGKDSDSYYCGCYGWD